MSEFSAREVGRRVLAAESDLRAQLVGLLTNVDSPD